MPAVQAGDERGVEPAGEGAQQGAPTGAPTEDGGAAKAEDVVEADYEIVDDKK